MYRLTFSIFAILPWWAYLALSILLAMAAQGLWSNATTLEARAEAEILAGPPPIVKVGDYDGYIRSDPFREVRLAGLIRSDLGVGRVEGTTPKSYLVLDGANRDGPVVAVLFVGSEGQGGLADLVATANENGLVIANGFARTLDRSAIAGQLRVQGVRREVVLIEAIVGDRAVALREKATVDKPFAMIVAGLSAIALLAALWRYSRWRKRRQFRALRKGVVPASAPKPVPAIPTPQQSAAPEPSPWGQFKPVDDVVSAPPPVPARRTAPQPTRRRTPNPSDEAPLSDQPPFESVFPGGGSGFRFKTADEIIRETFGTVSRLSPSTPDPE